MKLEVAVSNCFLLREKRKQVKFTNTYLFTPSELTCSIHFKSSTTDSFGTPKSSHLGIPFAFVRDDIARWIRFDSFACLAKRTLVDNINGVAILSPPPSRTEPEFKGAPMIKFINPSCTTGGSDLTETARPSTSLVICRYLASLKSNTSSLQKIC